MATGKVGAYVQRILEGFLGIFVRACWKGHNSDESRGRAKAKSGRAEWN